ncbi:MAG TPA: polysaccharide deacetylase family protein [Chthonomonadaceae bacterium]|nr:polysaccharide deacetylase family protein [Chthonomonadaceae bacterium]
MKSQLLVALLWLLFLWAATERRAGVHEAEPPPPIPKVAAKTTQDNLSAPLPSVRIPKGTLPPNEVGVVPIFEYHEISRTEKWMSRSIPHFRHDLERLYTEGYRPISMKEYLDNRIDLPQGLSPVILTFDDARQSQFSYLSNGKLDPNCAVAILQQFHERHPDFALRAMFFVLPDAAFEQRGWVGQKLQALLDMGFELGNHTVTHRNMTRMSDAEVQKEIFLCKAKIEKLAPKAVVDTLAFPGGNAPRHLSLVLAGKYQGQSYTNRAGFLAYGGPAPSPVSVDLDRRRILRLVATGDPGGTSDWLNWLKRHPELRYVSDGDPNIITVPKAKMKYVDRAKLNGAALRTY